MVFKIFLPNYSLRLPRLLLFSALLGITLLGSCVSENTSEKLVVPDNIIRTPISFFDNGNPKSVNLFVLADGRKVLYGYEEMHENGTLKIEGRLDSISKRDGLWQSYYMDGAKWSIGTYIHGEEIGEKKVWYPNGKIRYQGQMQNGKSVGTWIFWDEQGIETKKVYN